MAYSNFTTLTQVLKAFEIGVKNTLVFDNIKAKDPSSWLVETLDFAKTLPLTSEKARSEAIVAPVLYEIKKQTNSISVHSGDRLDVDPTKNLNGECDFILSIQPDIPEITTPIFGLVEAKKNDLDLGLAQCLAQMVGAKIFNEKDNKFFPAIYGCVTTGEIWQFMKLQDNVVYIDERRYYIDRVELILGVLERIVKEFI